MLICSFKSIFSLILRGWGMNKCSQMTHRLPRLIVSLLFSQAVSLVRVLVDQLILLLLFYIELETTNWLWSRRENSSLKSSSVLVLVASNCEALPTLCQYKPGLEFRLEGWNLFETTTQTLKIFLIRLDLNKQVSRKWVFKVVYHLQSEKVEILQGLQSFPSSPSHICKKKQWYWVDSFLSVCPCYCPSVRPSLRKSAVTFKPKLKIHPFLRILTNPQGLGAASCPKVE